MRTTTATGTGRRPLFLFFALLIGGVLGAGLVFGLGHFSDNFNNSDNNSANLPLGLWASASCESNGAILSTGYFDSNVELLYYLDSQNGRLSAGLLSRSEPGFVKTYTRNVKADLAAAAAELKNVALPQNPSFIMVSGDGDTRNTGGSETSFLSKSFLYVAEVNTGIVLVYVVPRLGDRDIGVDWGEITFWTSARLNTGSVAPPAPEAGTRKPNKNISASYMSTK